MKPEHFREVFTCAGCNHRDYKRSSTGFDSDHLDGVYFCEHPNHKFDLGLILSCVCDDFERDK